MSLFLNSSFSFVDSSFSSVGKHNFDSDVFADCECDCVFVDCEGIDCEGIDCEGIDCEGIDCEGIDCDCDLNVD
jgi:hypothetical protein